MMDDPCSPLPALVGNKWLIERRWRIQCLCLELYDYLEKNEIAVKADWRFFSPLLAAAFSLWRAAFLADPDRKWEDIYEHAKTFFKFLIEDNAINYPQDRTTRAYSAGYYLNNAKFRLREVWDYIPHDIYERREKRLLSHFGGLISTAIVRPTSGIYCTVRSA